MSGSTIFSRIFSQTARFSGEKVIEHKKCVLIFPKKILSETFLTIRRIWRDIIINVHTTSCKVTVIIFSC